MRPFILIFLIVPLIAAAGDPVFISPDNPKPGEPVTLLYNPSSDNAVIQKPEELYVYALHWMRSGDPVYQKHPMKKQNGEWKTSLSPLDEETFYIQIKFVSAAEDDDNDGRFWDVMYYTEDGLVHPDTYYLLGRSWMKRPDWAAAFSGAEMLRGYHREEAAAVFAEGYGHYPDDTGIVRMHIQFQASHIKEQDNYKELKEELLNIASRLEQNHPDEPWVLTSVARMYNLLGDEEEKYREYRERILESYPTHESVELWRHSDISDRDVQPSVRVERAKAFLNDFPGSVHSRSTVLQLVLSLVEIELFDTAYEYLTSYEDADPELYYVYISRLAEHNGGPRKLIAAVNSTIQLIDTPPSTEKPSYVTDREWAKRFESPRWKDMTRWISNAVDMFAANAYLELEKTDEALGSVTRAYENSQGNDAAINNKYIEILNASGKYEKAIDAGRSAIVKNKAGNVLIDHLKAAYIEHHRSDEGFPEFYDKAMSEALEILREKFAENMRDDPAHDFTLMQLDGEPVSLSDLKGKVVILDFWATWCGPCISAFPHFQRVVDHYADNPDVVFLALNTWEGDLDDDRIGHVRTFIEDNNYTFHVLFDEDTVVGEYGVRGIPTRFAIGRDAKIRFMDVGFSGPGMFHEMVVQIDMLLEDEPLSTR